jgi:DNA-binding Lrp family transcriptional regulator
MKERVLRLVDAYREDSRRSLTELAIISGSRLSTVFKTLENLENRTIRRNVSLLNFSTIGFPLKMGFFLSSEDRQGLARFLSGHPNINSLIRLSGDYDFYAELFFPSMLEAEAFSEQLKASKLGKVIMTTFLEDIRQEEFKVSGRGDKK